MTKNKQQLKEQCDEVIDALTSLKNDDGVPKNVRSKIDEIIQNLNEDSEVSVRVGKSLHTLDEISEDMNLQPFIRTQIWNISSMLEKLNSTE